MNNSNETMQGMAKHSIILSIGAIIAICILILPYLTGTNSLFSGLRL